MPEFELVLLLLVAVALIVTLARRLNVPYPILLILGGLVLAAIPWVPDIELDPEIVLVIFLPPLIFAAAWQTPVHDLRRNLRPVLLLSVGLVVFTALVVGAVLQWLVPGLPLAAAISFGAIVAPTDAIAATSVLRRLAVPRRVILILESESLLNDATALTLYRAAIAAVAAGGFILSDTLVTFGVAAVGGVVFGLLLAIVIARLWARLFDPPVEVTLSLLIPYAAYLPAEQLHFSGVIATATCGLYLGFRSSRLLASDARVLANGAWEIVVFILNGFAFMLIGLQLKVTAAGLIGHTPAELARPVDRHLADRDRDALRADHPGRRRAALVDDRRRGPRARPAGDLVGDRHRVGRSARRRLPGLGAGAAARLSGAQPADLPDLRGDHGHARRAGPHAAVAAPAAGNQRW